MKDQIVLTSKVLAHDHQLDRIGLSLPCSHGTFRIAFAKIVDSMLLNILIRHKIVLKLTGGSWMRDQTSSGQKLTPLVNQAELIIAMHVAAYVGPAYL